MLKAIFFKESIKLRWSCLTLLGLNMLLMGYMFIHTRHLFVMDHAEMVWYRVLHLGQIPYDLFTCAPMLTGMIIGLLQYLPEMAGERLRLLLHLPPFPHRLILGHILAGLCAVALIVGVDLLSLATITATYFPLDAVWMALETALPWSLAGVAAYLGVALSLLEPNFRLKLFNMVLSAAITGLFLLPSNSGQSLHLTPWLMLPILLMIPGILLPAYHFRYRKVS